MTLLIRKPGILSTIQDLGRFGGRSFGINPSGVMDRGATRVLNTILGNDERAPVLEMHFPAPEIEFVDDTSFAIGGADFGAEINGVPCRNFSVASASRGSLLTFRRRRAGQRAYLAVAGGFKADFWLGSASTNLTAEIGGHRGKRLQAGDRLECPRSGELSTLTSGSLGATRGDSPLIRIIAGPEFPLLTALSKRTFLRETFELTTSCDRMGFRLAGKALGLLDEFEMVSAAVTFGTIQLLPDGQLIILMADHQTTGGYPRIGNVVNVDLPQLAQRGPGDRIRFEMISIEQAEAFSLQFERELNFLRVGCRLQGRNAES